MGFVPMSAGAVSMSSGRSAPVSLAEADPEQWRAQIAWAPQRPHVFAASLADNLRLAWPDATDRPYMYARVADAPLGLNGFYTWNKTTGAATPINEIPATAVGTNVPGTEGYDPQQPDDTILESDEDINP